MSKNKTKKSGAQTGPDEPKNEQLAENALNSDQPVGETDLEKTEAVVKRWPAEGDHGVEYGTAKNNPDDNPNQELYTDEEKKSAENSELSFGEYLEEKKLKVWGPTADRGTTADWVNLVAVLGEERALLLKESENIKMLANTRLMINTSELDPNELMRLHGEVSHSGTARVAALERSIDRVPADDEQAEGKTPPVPREKKGNYRISRR